VRTRDTATGVPEVLEIGDDPGRPRLSSTAAVGALCLALGLGGGVSLQRERGAEDSRADQALLSSAAVIENPNLIHGARYLVTIKNVGRQELTIGRVTVQGWAVGAPWVEQMSVPAGSWAEVPLHVAFDCRVQPPPPEQVVVQGRLGDDTFRQVLPLSSMAGPLTVDWENRCQAPTGRVPTPEELEGVWLVQEGESLEGSVVLRFLEGNRLVLVDGTTAIRFSSAALVARYALSGSRLTAEAETGYDCRFGNRWEWTTTLGDDDRLYLHHTDSEATRCRRDLGEVWVAERLDPDLSPWLMALR
jgi:hypothetical protein